MKIKDAIRLLASDGNMDEEIVIAWWSNDAFDDDDEEDGTTIPAKDWEAFSNYIGDRMDWSGVHADITESYENWKEQQEGAIDTTVEPDVCPEPDCKANLDEHTPHYGNMNVDTEMAWREVTCEECGTKWTERYTFDHFVIED